MPKSVRQLLVAVLLTVSMLAQGTWALAGTTGGISGTVLDTETQVPVANAQVTAVSPSQTATAKTDAAGHFTFLSLAPDTYTISIEKNQYDSISEAGVTVFADATQTVSLTMHKTLTTIIHMTSKASGSLVKSGTTSDVYSVNAATQDKISALGGGGSLNSAYAAVASVPGAFVPLNQTGYYQTVHIRGGDYDQVGYELDGVPVNRSFDNYPSGALSSLGMQELQVYTGAAPSNSEGQGLAGYINQVIKTGSYPGFGSFGLGVGAPAFYHKAAVEVGGATPNRMFSYYVGVGGYNQDFRYVDQNNAPLRGQYGFLAPPLAELPGPINAAGNPDCTLAAAIDYSACYANGGVGPGGYALAPNAGVPSLANLSDRDVIVNLHFDLPHKFDGGRDNLQLLLDSGAIHNSFYFSTNDQGGAAYLNAIGEGVPSYADGFQYSGPTGVLLSSLANPASYVSNYYFPNSPAHAFGGAIPLDARDTTWNNQEIVKLQYQKNFGSDAYLRLYGYTYYSDWLQNGPQSTFSNFIGPVSPDYELNSHTRGVSATLAKQLNSRNLLSLQASYTTASSTRDNNTQMLNAGGKRSRGVVLVNANDPLSGACYGYVTDPNNPLYNPNALQQVSCDPSNGSKVRAQYLSWADLQGGSIPNPPAGCGSGPCGWLVAENSLYATYNTVKPKFGSYSINDQWRPTDKLLVNLGVRLDDYTYDGSSTNPGDPARAFWFASFNAEKCVQASTGRLFDKTADLGVTIGTPCSSIATNGGGFTAPNLTNASAQVLSYNELQPRLSGTYTINPLNVLRFSFGKYAEPPNAAFEQYNSLQENLPSVLGAFVPFGFDTPGHVIRPAVSYNTDFSWEHQLKGTDLSFKVSPFLRRTKDQIQQFFLDQKSGFVSGLNVGRQTSEGVEFQLDKGDFNRNGLAGMLSFAYTHSFIDYDTLANGNTVVSGINQDIDAFNALTKAGGGQPCYTPQYVSGKYVGSTPGACGAGSFANPYYNTPLQGHVSANGLPTYDLLPGPVGASADAFGAPYVATLVLNYKHDKLAITPSFQLQAGSRYGSPESNLGVDPSTCLALAGSNSGNDPRYNTGGSGWGGQNGVPGYDATTCGGTMPIPNVLSKHFDGMGEYVQPAQLVANLQLSYDVSQKVTLVGTFANVLNTCFGGSKEPWTMKNGNICSYGLVYGGLINPVGNVFNPGANIQGGLAYPYQASLGGVNVDGNSTKTPFNFYLDARIRL